jgi:hypothetical protein
VNQNQAPPKNKRQKKTSHAKSKPTTVFFESKERSKHRHACSLQFSKKERDADFRP